MHERTLRLSSPPPSAPAPTGSMRQPRRARTTTTLPTLQRSARWSSRSRRLLVYSTRAAVRSPIACGSHLLMPPCCRRGAYAPPLLLSCQVRVRSLTRSGGGGCISAPMYSFSRINSSSNRHHSSWSWRRPPSPNSNNSRRRSNNNSLPATKISTSSPSCWRSRLRHRPMRTASPLLRMSLVVVQAVVWHQHQHQLQLQLQHQRQRQTTTLRTGSSRCCSHRCYSSVDV